MLEMGVFLKLLRERRIYSEASEMWEASPCEILYFKYRQSALAALEVPYNLINTKGN